MVFILKIFKDSVVTAKGSSSQVADAAASNHKITRHYTLFRKYS
ncbi:hypothetical protein Metig_1635 [Methanotorris igneus Kol 5]|uniref:Uncharacterized protein n=1 Tax=Methanotorris igneus (strain DSM 5666 / JCM 11834 / Kol 5) TaxID=880724 RepID=F6BBG1_METIK|nr:hypothetical protein Metig_1635 [Methanotorris igneus Kol 5]